MQSRIGCICLSFFHCVFSNVSSNRLPERMQNHIGCICLTFLHCVFSNVSSNVLCERRQSHIGYICSTFQHFSSGFSHLHPSNKSHDFQDFVPLPRCLVLNPKCCFKLNQNYHWLLVSNNQNCFLFQALLSLFHFKANFLVRENTSWKYILKIRGGIKGR